MNNATDIALATGKAALNRIGEIIPIIGFAKDVYENLSEIQVARKQERLVKFVEHLSISIETVKERLNSDYISQNDFIDIFERASKYIANERNEEKRRCFMNVLLNSMTDADVDYDRTERFLRILDNLCCDDLIVLAVLDNPVKYNQTHGMIIPDPARNTYQTIWQTVSGGGILTRILGKRDYEIRESVNCLFYNGLVEQNVMDVSLQTNGNPIHVLNNKLTIRGRQFVSFLKEIPAHGDAAVCHAGALP